MTFNRQTEQAYRVQERLGMLYGGEPVTREQIAEVTNQIQMELDTIERQEIADEWKGK